MTVISGRTRMIAHLGLPTETFKSPMIYNPWFEAMGIDTIVMPMGCESEDYPEFLKLVFRLRNIAGALITMPHKVTTVGLLDEASTAVRICGACNAVKRDDAGRLVGEMFDGDGFVSGVERKGRSIAGAGALVVGNGGVGSAIAAALAKAGAARIGLFDAKVAATARLAASLAVYYPHVDLHTGSNDPKGWDIIVNATPLGMNEADPMPMDIERIEADSFVGEVVMKKQETAFLAAVKQRGCLTQVGTDMLFEQIPAYLEFFGYPRPTADELRAHARITY